MVSNKIHDRVRDPLVCILSRTSQPFLFPFPFVDFMRLLITRSVFEASLILSQVTGLQQNKAGTIAPEPDFSASWAQRVVLLDMPGVTASLLAFVVFGTTQPFRKKMYKTFVPRRFQRQEPTRPQTRPYASNRDSTIGRRRLTFQHGDPYGHDVIMDDLGKSGSMSHDHKSSEDELPILPPPSHIAKQNMV